MQPLECAQCGNRVLVEKFSWQHTSVQWLSDSASCAEFKGSSDSTETTVHVNSCSALQESIRQAVLDGRISVPEE
jgi:hypothetical protein